MRPPHFFFWFFKERHIFFYHSVALVSVNTMVYFFLVVVVVVVFCLSVCFLFLFLSNFEFFVNFSYHLHNFSYFKKSEEMGAPTVRHYFSGLMGGLGVKLWDGDVE